MHIFHRLGIKVFWTPYTIFQLQYFHLLLGSRGSPGVSGPSPGESLSDAVWGGGSPIRVREILNLLLMQKIANKLFYTVVGNKGCFFLPYRFFHSLR